VTIKGVTERVRTGHGNMYVTINFDQKGEPFEVFTTLGKSGGCDSAQLEAISRLVSLALRSGIEPNKILEDLRGITCCPAWDGGTLVRSAPDGVALALSRHLREDFQPAQEPEATTEPMFAMAQGQEDTNGNGRGSINGTRCPDCSVGTLVHQEGCLRCPECGYNKCE
jgi:ribonucleoside-diphosphate reductase alpha chain